MCVLSVHDDVPLTRLTADRSGQGNVLFGQLYTQHAIKDCTVAFPGKFSEVGGADLRTADRSAGRAGLLSPVHA